jgi:hypothetical protein
MVYSIHFVAQKSSPSEKTEALGMGSPAQAQTQITDCTTQLIN